jgi:hypothetical protein
MADWSYNLKHKVILSCGSAIRSAQPAISGRAPVALSLQSSSKCVLDAFKKQKYLIQFLYATSRFLSSRECFICMGEETLIAGGSLEQ